LAHTLAYFALKSGYVNFGLFFFCFKVRNLHRTDKQTCL